MKTSRRTFIKEIGLSAAALSLPGAGFSSGIEDKFSLLNKFKAVGATQPVRLPPHETAVKVFFDLVPATLQFTLPSFPSMVTENGIVFSNAWTETYDQPVSGLSFETLQDQKNLYARMWIEHMSDARIIVRVRGALCNNKGQIAHANIPSGSPYGEGDWVDEWYYIYPDGMHTRYVKIYTGLAPRSRPFGIDHDPPQVVHEFEEAMILGKPGHLPTDDIETNALTLIRLIGGHVNRYLPDGESATISYKPYPNGFGNLRDGHIMLINLKSKYKPYTIGLPYGCRTSPYWPEGKLPHIFQTWGNPPKEGYSSSLCNMANYWHFRRTDNTLEQVYLQGMTNAENPKKEIVSYAWSWITNPNLKMEATKKYSFNIIYDRTQKAYIIPHTGRGPKMLKFSLVKNEDSGQFGAPMWIINPVFVIKEWGKSEIELKMDGEPIVKGKDFQVGYEETPTGTDLIVWVKYKSQKDTHFEIKPVN